MVFCDNGTLCHVKAKSSALDPTLGSFQKSLGMFESFCKDEAIVCVEETVWKKRVSVPVQLVKKVINKDIKQRRGKRRALEYTASPLERRGYVII